MRAVGSIGALAAAALMSCAPPATEASFDSPNSAARLYAIEKALRTGDTGAVPRLVEQLESDDPAVRMLAIEALHRLTGETHGYRHDDPPLARHEAIRRWVESLEPTAAGRMAGDTSSESVYGRH